MRLRCHCLAIRPTAGNTVDSVRTGHIDRHNPVDPGETMDSSGHCVEVRALLCGKLGAEWPVVRCSQPTNDSHLSSPPALPTPPSFPSLNILFSASNPRTATAAALPKTRTTTGNNNKNNNNTSYLLQRFGCLLVRRVGVDSGQLRQIRRERLQPQQRELRVGVQPLREVGRVQIHVPAPSRRFTFVCCGSLCFVWLCSIPSRFKSIRSVSFRFVSIRRRDQKPASRMRTFPPATKRSTLPLLVRNIVVQGGDRCLASSSRTHWGG